MRRLLVILALLCLSTTSARAQITASGTVVIGGSATSLSLSLSSGLQQLKQNLPVSGRINCQGGSGSGYTITYTGTPPNGVTITQGLNGGVASGTPTGTSPATINVTCTDSNSSTIGPTAFTLTPASLSTIGPISSLFLPATINSSSTLTPPANACPSSWSDGSTLDLTMTASWSSGSTGVATIGLHTGVITAVAAGSSSITCAFNSTTSLGATVLVSNSSPVVTTTALPFVIGGNGTANGQQLIAYPVFCLMASGGTAPYTWAVTSGAAALVTANMAVSSAGCLTGTPNTNAATFSVTATDAGSNTSSPQSLTFTPATITTVTPSPAAANVTAGAMLQLSALGTFSDTSTADVTNISGGAGAPLQFVNGQTATTGGSSATSIATPSMSTTAANGLIVWISSLNLSTTPTLHVADGCGDTFTEIGQNTTSAGFHGDLWYVLNIAGGNCAVTCSETGVAPPGLMRFSCTVAQYIGLPTSSALDVESHATHGSSGNACSDSLTTTNANDLIVQGCISNQGQAGTFTAGAGYTIRSQDGEQALEDQFVNATGTLTPMTNFGGSPVSWLVNSAAFKGASSGGSAWTSSNNAAATVNSSGLVTALTVAGNTTVPITDTVAGVSGTASITVQPAAITSITVTPANTSLPQNGVQPYTATGSPGNQNLTGSVVWGSSALSCATITPGGVATVLSASNCSTTISATFGVIQGGTTLTGTGVVSSNALLTSCTVSSGNTVQGCSGSYPPSGWTQALADGFETGGFASSNESFVSGSNSKSINAAQPHSGTHALDTFITAVYNGVGMQLLGSAIGSREIDLSWWQFIQQANSPFGMIYTDYYFAARPGRGDGSLGTAITQNWANGAGGCFYACISGQSFLSLTGSTQPNFSVYGATKTIPLNRYDQYEVHMKANTPGQNDGVLDMYLDGALVQHVDSSTKAPNTGCGGAGQPNCGDFVGSADFTNTALCVGCDWGDVTLSGNNQNMTNCEGTHNTTTCPPSGTIPFFHIYIDDVIVLKK